VAGASKRQGGTEVCVCGAFIASCGTRAGGVGLHQLVADPDRKAGCRSCQKLQVENQSAVEIILLSVSECALHILGLQRHIMLSMCSSHRSYTCCCAQVQAAHHHQGYDAACLPCHLLPPACRLREEVKEQIRALEELKHMAATYGCVGGPCAQAILVPKTCNGATKDSERGQQQSRQRSCRGRCKNMSMHGVAASKSKQTWAISTSAAAVWSNYTASLRRVLCTCRHDISRPATTSQEAVQWVYYGYLGAVKEQVSRGGGSRGVGRV
jgi:hypothetical protein